MSNEQKTGKIQNLTLEICLSRNLISYSDSVSQGASSTFFSFLSAINIERAMTRFPKNPSLKSQITHCQISQNVIIRLA